MAAYSSPARPGWIGSRRRSPKLIGAGHQVVRARPPPDASAEGHPAAAGARVASRRSRRPRKAWRAGRRADSDGVIPPGVQSTTSRRHEAAARTDLRPAIETMGAELEGSDRPLVHRLRTAPDSAWDAPATEQGHARSRLGFRRRGSPPRR